MVYRYLTQDAPPAICHLEGFAFHTSEKPSGTNSPAVSNDAIISRVIAAAFSPDLLPWLAGTMHIAQSSVMTSINYRD